MLFTDLGVTAVSYPVTCEQGLCFDLRSDPRFFFILEFTFDQVFKLVCRICTEQIPTPHISEAEVTKGLMVLSAKLQRK